MRNTASLSESSSGGTAPIPSPGAGSRPGPYESPRRVLRGYDQPASVPARDERDLPVRPSGRDLRR